MKYTYAVLGGGRQGTAAAYDMVKFGDAKAVRIADIDRAAARACADQVNRMLQTDVARGVELDVTDERSLESFLSDVDSFLSAVPYWLNPKITAGPDDHDFVIIRIRARGPDLKGRRQSAIVGLANDAVIIVELTGSNVHPEGGPDLRIWYTAFEIWISWTATPVRSATVIWESVVRRSAGSAMTLPSSRTSPSCNTPALSA